eukprot:TRINITY_DN11357_c0_g3_i4.p1 TRINITY_DN11357_c0_g3~~TRINITY_DN11357_c0_g3_i4.p1  ORF type:complete len:396 (-),score=79.63 TRINITY_DN11357_c0_g3_i4:282-1469(-)
MLVWNSRVYPFVRSFLVFCYHKQIAQPKEVWITQAIILAFIALIYLLRRYIIKYNVFGRIGIAAMRVRKKIDEVLARVAVTSRFAASMLPHLFYWAVFAFLAWVFPYPGVAAALLPIFEVLFPVLRTLVATNTCISRELDKCSMFWVVWAFMMILKYAWRMGSSFIPGFLLKYTQSSDTLSLFWMIWLQAPFGGLSSIYTLAKPFIHERLQFLSSADSFVDRIISTSKVFLPQGFHGVLAVFHRSWMSLLSVFTLLAMYPISLIGLLYVGCAVPAIKIVNAMSVKNMEVQIEWLGFCTVYCLTDFVARTIDLWNWIPLGFGIMFHTAWILALQVPPLDIASRVFENLESLVGNLIEVIDSRLHAINPDLSASMFGVASRKHLKPAEMRIPKPKLD